MTTPTAPAERPAYLAFLPVFLFRPRGSKAAYVLKAWPVALIPSILLSATINMSVPSAKGPDLPLSGPLMVALVTIIGPFLETLIMAAVLLALRRFVGFGPAVVLSSVGWGVAHSSAAAIWGLVIWWPFLIFSIAFLTWRQRGFWSGILIVSAIHALQNSFAVALLLVGPRVTGLH